MSVRQFLTRQSFLFARLYYQPHIFHTHTVFGAGGNDINSCSVNAAVTENIGKFGEILFLLVKNAGKEMAEIMRKDL